MAPVRRSRRGQGRWVRRHGGNEEDTISGDSIRRVLDSYCPHCATDIRSVRPRRLVRCPNISICGKLLPIDNECCPNCRHYTRRGDNFCRVCRNNLRSVVRGRGGLYQALSRVPSPNHSPPRPQEPEQQGNEAGGSGVVANNNNRSSSDDDSSDEEFQNPNILGNGGRNGILRVVAIEDDLDD